MKVGICGHHLGHGGKGRYAENLIQGLASRSDIEVTVINSEKELPVAEYAYISPDTKLESTALKAARQFLNGGKINNLGLDLLHCPSEIVPPYVWRADVPTVVTFGGDGLFCQMGFVRRLRLYRGIITGRNLVALLSTYLFKNQVDMFVTVSEMMTGNIANAYDISIDRITPLHHGYDPATFREVSSDSVEKVLSELGISSPYLLHVSNFRKIKNVDRILQAFREASTRWDDDVELVLVGPKNESQRQYRARCRELSITDRTKFPGRVDDTMLPALYTGAEALCQPSVRETFSFPVLESLACGTPTIVSSEVGVLEERPNTQLRVDPMDVRDIRTHMEQVVGDDQLQRELVCDIADLVERHRWEEVIPRYVDLYESMLDGRGSNPSLRGPGSGKHGV